MSKQTIHIAMNVLFEFAEEERDLMPEEIAHFDKCRVCRTNLNELLRQRTSPLLGKLKVQHPFKFKVCVP